MWDNRTSKVEGDVNIIKTYNTRKRDTLITGINKAFKENKDQIFSGTE